MSSPEESCPDAKLLTIGVHRVIQSRDDLDEQFPARADSVTIHDES
jgi:hypothetical protein